MTVAMMCAYLLTGLFAGVMSGLLGLGGGIVVVPALAALFLHNHDIPVQLHMRMAIGTSLAIMIVTLASSVYAHQRRGTINWSMIKAVFPGLIVGIIVGTVLVCFLSSGYLSRFFGIFLLIMVLRLLFFDEDKSEGGVKMISPCLIASISALIGVLASLLGVGGGTMWVPFFLHCRLSMREAVGTSVVCGMLAAIVATMGFMAADLFVNLSIPWSTSYIYWPAFLGVSIAGVIFAPIGVAMAYKLSARLLKYAFVLLLLGMAIQMIFFTR